MAIRGLIVFIVATGIGLTFSWFAGQGAATYADLPVFLLSAALAYVVNWVVFIPSAIARSEKYFDITGTLTYFTLIISALMLSPAPDTRALAVAAMGGLFSATVRAPLVGVVLIAELTGAYSVMVPAIVTCLLANAVADRLGGRPIYEVLLERTLRLAGEAPGRSDRATADSSRQLGGWDQR